MKWSKDIRALARGIKLGTRIAKATLTSPKPDAVMPPQTSRLLAFSEFGDNPGKLRMLAHIPPAVASGAPLVVLLHGCGQNAAAFAADSGWIALADRLRFPLILPSQAEANNAGRCFQWFHPADTARGSGEAGSIAAMTRTAIARFHSDRSRIFIVGLSAGGAMAAAMLAAYPDLFAAGASVAGLPVGSARSGMQAMLRMASAGPEQSPDAWASQVRAAAPQGFAGPWPRLSIWQGQADTTVAPANANLLATQWCALHGLPPAAMVEQARDGVRHRIWPDAKRRVVELWSIADLPHAYPSGERRVAAGHFVEPAPVDATTAIAAFFGLD